MGLRAEVTIMNFGSDSHDFGIPFPYELVVEGMPFTALGFAFLFCEMEIVKVMFRNVMIHKIAYFSIICSRWQVLST